MNQHSYFEIATGLAGLVSLAVTLLKLFPNYQQFTRYFMTFAFGAFSGSIAARLIVGDFDPAIETYAPKLFVEIAFVFSILLIFVIIISVMAGAILDDKITFSGLSLIFVFFISGLALLIFNGAGGKQYSVSNFEEFTALARYYRDQGRIGASLEYYETALEYLRKFGRDENNPVFDKLVIEMNAVEAKLMGENPSADTEPQDQ